MKIAIAVFAKTPGLSPVKTRLALSIGETQANAFYIKSVAAVRENLKALKLLCKTETINHTEMTELDIWWALAEEEGVNHPFWKEDQCLWTGEGSLGERLYQVTRELFQQYEYVFVMGTDSPQVGAPELYKMINSINGSKETSINCSKEISIIGPCSDGGFYIFGSPKELGKDFWLSIPYSQSNTCQHLIQGIEGLGQPYEVMGTFGDVDHVADLHRLKKELWEIQNSHNGHRDLLEWLNQQELNEQALGQPDLSQQD